LVRLSEKVQGEN